MATKTINNVQYQEVCLSNSNIISSTAIPLKGQIVYDTTLNSIKVGNGSTALKSLQYISGACPIGGMIYSAASTIPTGFLACDGRAISRTTYSRLFSVIGTTWGAGDGSTTFNIPDTFGKCPQPFTSAGGYYDGAKHTHSTQFRAYASHWKIGGGNDQRTMAYTAQGAPGPNYIYALRARSVTTNIAQSNRYGNILSLGNTSQNTSSLYPKINFYILIKY